MLKNIFLILLLSMQIYASTSIVSVLQQNNIATIYPIIINAESNPTEMETSGYDNASQSWLSLTFGLPSFNWQNGAFVSLSSVSGGCDVSNQKPACLSYTYSVLDIFGTVLTPPTHKQVINGQHFFSPASFNGVFAWLKGMRNKTEVLWNFSDAAFFIANKNIQWPKLEIVGVVPPVSTDFGYEISQIGGTPKTIGLAFPNDSISNDITIIVLTSAANPSVKPSTLAVYTLTGSSAISGIQNALNNGIYIVVGSWANGSSYFISDNQGKQLGTGTVAGVGTASGTILGALVYCSATNSALMPAVSGAIPNVMLLQTPIPQAYVAGANNTAGKKLKHHDKKHFKKEIKKIDKLLAENKTAQTTYETDSAKGGALFYQAASETVKSLKKYKNELQKKLDKAG